MTSINRIGHRYSRLTIIGFGDVSASGVRRWQCRCDCGIIKLIQWPNLRTGASRSCGCLRRELARAAHLKHGGSTRFKITKEYATWGRIKQRCFNPKTEFFADYGGRGITMYGEWRESFPRFLADMGPCPLGPGYSIDRWPNNNGNYEPGNCRWATDAQQRLNTRSNYRITFNDETMTLKEWADRLHIHRTVISKRIVKLGWSVAQALSTPRLRQKDGNGAFLAFYVGAHPHGLALESTVQ